jgi:alpha-D-xyloside xylohydrolase
MDSTEPDIVNANSKESTEYELKRMENNHLGSFARYLNPYSLLATEAVYKNQRLETDQKRVYILTRSTFAGQQRAAATTWSGDIGASWSIYKDQIAAGFNHSMSGIPYWTFDIGAFVLGSYGGVFHKRREGSCLSGIIHPYVPVGVFLSHFPFAWLRDSP